MNGKGVENIARMGQIAALADDFLEQEAARWLERSASGEREMVLPEEGHLLQTVSLVREAYRTAGDRRKPMGFFLFTVRQIRYAGRYVWAWQCLLLFGILTVFCGFTRNWSGADLDLMMFLYRRIPLFLCGAGVASAWSCVPLLARARRWQMAEVELAGCSAARLRLAQLLISGGSALTVGGISAFAAWRLWAIGIESLAAYLFLPFMCSTQNTVDKATDPCYHIGDIYR